VAHDINNALTPLMNYIDLLEWECGLNDSGKRWTQLIRMGVKDTAETVKRLDHFYRTSHNQRLLSPLNMADVAKQVIELTRPRWLDQAQTEGMEIQVIADIVTEPVVNGEASQLRAVLTNLVFNSLDAIDQSGSIVIRIDSLEDMAVIDVIDTGHGMSVDQVERCTEPFYTSRPHGSGLGLSECEGIVRQHSGRLMIQSVLHQGTTVRIELPCSDADNDQATTPLIVNSNTAGMQRHAGTGAASTPRILCIDDDELVRQSTMALLSTLGVHAEAATDGPSGLDRLEQESFQLVLCDQGLPGMDGLAVLRIIKQRWPDLPVVMISGWSLPDLNDDLQPDEFVEKPFSVNDLRHIVDKYLVSSPTTV
jgi:CheY-like chemotaxis protein